MSVAAKTIETTKRKKRAAAGKKTATTMRCHTCAAKIAVPKGWSRGAAVRRHYWREHPTVMTARRRKLDS